MGPISVREAAETARLTPRSLRRRSVRAGLLAAIVATSVIGLGASSAAASDATSRALDILNHSYGSFMSIKRRHEAPFDWSSDGCTWTPPPWRWEQDGPCQLHDFGYRNFGTGLRLERTERRRAWIDHRFLDEMRRNCRQHWWYTSCGNGIYVMYGVVRNASDWHD